MSCPSCIVALSGPGPLDTISSRLGKTGTMVVLGAVGGLIGYAVGKTVGGAAGAVAGVAGAWYLMRDQASPDGALQPGEPTTPPILQKSPKFVVPQLTPIPQAASSSTTTRLRAGGSPTTQQQLRCWSR